MFFSFHFFSLSYTRSYIIFPVVFVKAALAQLYTTVHTWNPCSKNPMKISLESVSWAIFSVNFSCWYVQIALWGDYKKVSYRFLYIIPIKSFLAFTPQSTLSKMFIKSSHSYPYGLHTFTFFTNHTVFVIGKLLKNLLCMVYLNRDC